MTKAIIFIFLILATVTAHAESLNVRVNVPIICNLTAVNPIGSFVVYKRFCNTQHRITVNGVEYGVFQASNDTIELPKGRYTIEAI